jgi:hypothetical protein
MNRLEDDKMVQGADAFSKIPPKYPSVASFHSAPLDVETRKTQKLLGLSMFYRMSWNLLKLVSGGGRGLLQTRLRYQIPC